jgi:hypothetical protein
LVTALQTTTIEIQHQVAAAAAAATPLATSTLLKGDLLLCRQIQRSFWNFKPGCSL